MNPERMGRETEESDNADGEDKAVEEEEDDEVFLKMSSNNNSPKPNQNPGDFDPEVVAEDIRARIPIGQERKNIFLCIVYVDYRLD